MQHSVTVKLFMSLGIIYRKGTKRENDVIQEK
jgi:hypothetical protein